MPLRSRLLNNLKAKFHSSTDIPQSTAHPPQSQVPVTKIPKQLPFDIWSIILSGLITVPYVFDVTCTSETAMPFRNAWTGKECAAGYDKIIRTCRLVCKLWKEIADSCEVKWCRDPHFFHETTRRLDIIEERWTQSAYDNFNAFCSDYLWPPMMKTLSVSTTSAADPTSPFFLPIFQAISGLGSIQSLCFTVGEVTPEFLKKLQYTFPFLTSLSITTDTFIGSLEFKRLQVLELRVSVFHAESVSLPSLKHLFVDTEGGIFLWMGFFSNLSSLHSLCFNLFIILNARFWEKHPEIEFISAPTSVWPNFSPPLDSHPFSHWGLAHIDTSTVDYAMEIKRYPHRKFPNLKRLTIPSKYREMAEEEWVSLVLECSESGIVAVDDDGKLLQPARPS